MTRILGVLVAVASVPLLASPSGAVFLAGCALLVAGTVVFARPVPPRDGEGGAPVRRRATPTLSPVPVLPKSVEPGRPGPHRPRTADGPGHTNVDGAS